MAKSIRSKSARKARAILHTKVFKAVEDERTARLGAKLAAIPGSEVPGAASMDVDGVAPQRELVRTGRRKKTAGFNLYGLGKRESRF